MEQLDLFDDLVPIQQYLHVWTEAERARQLNKKSTPGRLERCAETVMRPSSACKPADPSGTGRDECT